MADMEFRANFIIWVMVNLVWAVLALVFVELVFGQVTLVAGWNRVEVMLLAATQVIFLSALWFSVFPNVNRFSQLVQKGDLDFTLLKPVSSRFLISTRYVEFDNLTKVILAPFLIPLLLRYLNITISPLAVVNYIVMLILGLAIFYNFFFIIMTTNFWFQNVFNLEHLLDSVTDMGRWPVYIFKGLPRTIFMYVVPIAFVSTFPVEVLLGKAGWERTVLALALVVITSLISHRFWHFALRHYSSASS